MPAQTGEVPHPYRFRYMTSARRFPPPWSVEEPDSRLQQQCFIVRDAYFEGEIGRRAAAETAHPRRGAADRCEHRAKLPELLTLSYRKGKRVGDGKDSRPC
jgi:hypothetical protein